jgi:DNA-binding beta-propeller fold protein YncE
MRRNIEICFALFVLMLAGCGDSGSVVASPGLTGAAGFTPEISHGPVETVVFVAPPVKSVAGTPIPGPLQIECRDSLGQLLDTKVTITMGNNPVGGTLSGTTTRATANGVATFDNLVIDLPGPGYRLVATADSGASVVSAPFDVTPAGIVVLDLFNNRVVKFDDITGTGWATLDLPARSTRAMRDGLGRLFISAHDGLVRRVDDIGGTNLSTYALPGGGPLPSGLGLDAQNRLYIVEVNRGLVLRIDDLSGSNLATLGSLGSGIREFDEPDDLLIDSQGRIYVSDELNSRVVRFDDITGANWVSLGTSGTGVHQFRGPGGLALDDFGRIYVCDRTNHRIVRFDDMSGANWVSFGTQGSGIGQFEFPSGIDVGSSGQIYVADTRNHRIVRFDDMTGANWTTFGTSGSGTGEFDFPRDIIAP